MAEVTSGSSSQKRTRTGSCQKRKRPRLKSGYLVLDCVSNWTAVEHEEARRLGQSEASYPTSIIGANSSSSMEEGSLRRRSIHGLDSEMEASPSLTITGSRRGRSGNSHTYQSVDFVGGGGGGDVVDLTTDSGVEDEEIVDITDQHVDPPVIVPEEEYLHQRPSCRFSRPHSLVRSSNSASSADTDVIVINSPVGEPAQGRLLNSPSRSKPQQSLASGASGSVGKSTSQESTSTKKSIVCPICLDTIEQFEATGRKLVTTQCGHIFCNVCIRNSISTLHRCPTCRKKLTLKQYHHLYL